MKQIYFPGRAIAWHTEALTFSFSLQLKALKLSLAAAVAAAAVTERLPRVIDGRSP